MSANVCKRCRAVLSASKAAYVFPQTAGLCWSCHDRDADKRHRANLTPAQRKRMDSRWSAIDAVTDAEIRAHCQFDGLPDVGRRTK